MCAFWGGKVARRILGRKQLEDQGTYFVARRRQQARAGAVGQPHRSCWLLAKTTRVSELRVEKWHLHSTNAKFGHLSLHLEPCGCKI